MIKGAKSLLLNSPLEIEKTEFDAKIIIDRPEQMRMFFEEETRMVRTMIEKIGASGAHIVICQKGINDAALAYLAKANIAAVKRVKESIMTALAKATGARTVTNLDDLSQTDLGFAETEEERKVETEKWVLVEKCKNPKAVSILIRGGSERIVDEAERSMHDALMVVKDVVQKPAVLAGGGSPEAWISQNLRKWSSCIAGREQYAIMAFADAIEWIPNALAENADGCN